MRRKRRMSRSKKSLMKDEAAVAQLVILLFIKSWSEYALMAILCVAILDSLARWARFGLATVASPAFERSCFSTCCTEATISQKYGYGEVRSMICVALSSRAGLLSPTKFESDRGVIVSRGIDHLLRMVPPQDGVFRSETSS